MILKSSKRKPKRLPNNLELFNLDLNWSEDGAFVIWQGDLCPNGCELKIGLVKQERDVYTVNWLPWKLLLSLFECSRLELPMV